ncbi:hypothetical protein [Streptomyces kanamyceticus]|uniref:Uncharacterized protein n=1 Tax=Streptomyces kanamyceticus TaxID=1967 RepID=A0A5J6G7F9_STRKN|nr:hypothetical protein [Streptomyces kanamyceticus]QEU90887.1 hypothetical protein CP970_08295 [Streptomyces kanamyceticus]
MTTVNSTNAVTPKFEKVVQEGARDAGAEAIGGNVGEVWRSAQWWSPGNGAWDLPISLSVINANSTVVITASEVDGNGNRFVGSAPFQVDNIAPGNGVVWFKINIGWGSPLPMRTDVTVFN